MKKEKLCEECGMVYLHTKWEKDDRVCCQCSVNVIFCKECGKKIYVKFNYNKGIITCPFCKKYTVNIG